MTPPTGSDHRRVWRWHFFAGLAVTPVLLVVAATGGLYVFKDELERWADAEVVFVAPGPARVPLDDQVAAARDLLPAGYRPAGVDLPADPDRATVVSLQTVGQPARRVGVDPYTGRALGTLGDGRFFRVVLDLHRRLLLGTPGRLLVELATGWTVILLATGAYLWWPRGRERVRGVWLPRLGGRRYAVLRDLHTLAGVYLLPVLLTVAVTGFLYTLVAGSAYRSANRATGASASFSDLPKSPPAGDPLPVEAAVRIAQERYPDRPLSLTLPRRPDDSFVVFVRGRGGPPTQGVLVLRRTDGAVLRDTPLSELPAVSRVALWNYSLHVGSVWGTPTKLLWLLACLSLTGLPPTGLWMWWVRRPVGTAGLPRRPAGRVPGWLIGTAVPLGLLLPVAGGSVLLVLCGEWLVGRVRRRTPASG